MSANPKPLESWPLLDAVLSRWSSRKILTSDQFDALSAAAKARAGSLAGTWETKFVRAIYDSLGRAMRDNLSSAEWTTEAQKIVDSFGGGTKLGLYSGEDFSPAYAETVFRTNVAAALAAGRYADMFSPASRRMAGYVMLSAVHDDRNETEQGCPGTICRKLDGIVFPKDDPGVGQILTPLHFGCRCTIIELDQEDVDAGGYDVASSSDFTDLLSTPDVWSDDKLESLVDGPDALMEGVDIGVSPAPVFEGTALDPIEDYVRAWESQNVIEKVEHAVLFDVDGRELWTKIGVRDSVEISATDQKVLANGRLFSHNHPAGPSLSPEDLGVAARLNLQEIRAVGRIELANVPGITVQESGWLAIREYSVKPAAWQAFDFSSGFSDVMSTSWGAQGALRSAQWVELRDEIATSRIFANYQTRADALAAGFSREQIEAEWVEISRRGWAAFAQKHPELVYSERVLGFVKGKTFYPFAAGVPVPPGLTLARGAPPAWLLMLFSKL